MDDSLKEKIKRFDLKREVDKYERRLNKHEKEQFENMLFQIIMDLVSVQNFYKNENFELDLGSRVFSKLEYPPYLNCTSSVYFQERDQYIKAKPKKLYKYLDLKAAKNVLNKQTILFQNPINYDNDDCNFRELCDKKYRIRMNVIQNFLNKNDVQKIFNCTPVNYSMYGDIFKYTRNNLRVCCFCKINNSRKMWSEYAKDNGVCIEINPYAIDIMSHEVSYGGVFGTHILDYEVYQIIMHYCEELKEYLFFTILAQTYRSIFHKPNKFKEEMEWRFVKKAGVDVSEYLCGDINKELIAIPGAIVQVYLNPDVEYDDEIFSLCNNINITPEYIKFEDKPMV